VNRSGLSVPRPFPSPSNASNNSFSSLTCTGFRSAKNGSSAGPMYWYNACVRRVPSARTALSVCPKILGKIFRIGCGGTAWAPKRLTEHECRVPRCAGCAYSPHDLLHCEDTAGHYLWLFGTKPGNQVRLWWT
jgi:hypothetical protein